MQFPHLKFQFSARFLLGLGILLLPLNLCCAESLEPLTLGAAIQRAVAASSEVQIIRDDAAVAAQLEQQARGELDTFASASGYVSRENVPSGTAFTGDEYNSTDRGFNVGLEKRLAIGTDLAIGWDNYRSSSESLFSTLDPQFNSELSLRLRQPLLKGAWGGRPTIRIRAARRTGEAGWQSYQGILANKLQEIVQGYWNQSVALSEVRVGESSLTASKKLVEDVRSRVDVGLDAPLALDQARSQMLGDEQRLVAAKDRYERAATELRRLLGEEPSALISGPYALADEPHFKPLPFELDPSLNIALELRPEILAAKKSVDAAVLNARLANNSVLPDLALLVEGATRGFAGNGRDQPSVFEGGYGDALSAMDDRDFYRYRFGVEIRQPLENSRASADAETARIRERQARSQLTLTQQRVAAEIRNAIGGLQAAASQVKAAEGAKEAAEHALQTIEERYRVGLSTAREVIDQQRDTAAARTALQRALADHEASVTEVLRARGELLAFFGIVPTL